MSENASVRPSTALADPNVAPEVLDALEVLGSGPPDHAHPEERRTRVRWYGLNADAEPRAASREQGRTKVRGCHLNGERGVRNAEYPGTEEHTTVQRDESTG